MVNRTSVDDDLILHLLLILLSEFKEVNIHFTLDVRVFDDLSDEFSVSLLG